MAGKGRVAVVWDEKTLRDRCEEVGDCLIWMQACNSQGYPQACIDGKSGQMVRRWVYTKLMGKVIPPLHVVVSSCMDPKCCSQNHLGVMSCSKRLSLTHKQGLRMSAAEMVKRQQKCAFHDDMKLNLEVAKIIRSRRAERAEDLAKEYKVTCTHIRSIWRNEVWREANSASVFNWRP
jgi:hypothetical protein